MDKVSFIKDAETVIFSEKAYGDKMTLINLICKKHKVMEKARTIAVANLNRYTAINEIKIISESALGLGEKLIKVQKILKTYNVSDYADIMAIFCQAESL